MKTITGEEVFRMIGTHLIVSPAEGAYTFSYSADGISFTPWEDSTPAGEVLIVNGIPAGSYIKLVGNTGDVTIQMSI